MNRPLFANSRHAAGSLLAPQPQRTTRHPVAGVEQVIADADRDRWFTAEQARDYGLVDQVINSALQAADEGRPARGKDN